MGDRFVRVSVHCVFELGLMALKDITHGLRTQPEDKN